MNQAVAPRPGVSPSSVPSPISAPLQPKPLTSPAPAPSANFARLASESNSYAPAAPAGSFKETQSVTPEPSAPASSPSFPLLDEAIAKLGAAGCARVVMTNLQRVRDEAGDAVSALRALLKNAWRQLASLSTSSLNPVQRFEAMRKLFQETQRTAAPALRRADAALKALHNTLNGLNVAEESGAQAWTQALPAIHQSIAEEQAALSQTLQGFEMTQTVVDKVQSALSHTPKPLSLSALRTRSVREQYLRELDRSLLALEHLQHELSAVPAPPVALPIPGLGAALVSEFRQVIDTVVMPSSALNDQISHVRTQIAFLRQETAPVHRARAQCSPAVMARILADVERGGRSAEVVLADFAQLRAAVLAQRALIKKESFTAPPMTHEKAIQGFEYAHLSMLDTALHSAEVMVTQTGAAAQATALLGKPLTDLNMLLSDGLASVAELGAARVDWNDNRAELRVLPALPESAVMERRLDLEERGFELQLKIDRLQKSVEMADSRADHFLRQAAQAREACVQQQKALDERIAQLQAQSLQTHDRVELRHLQILIALSQRALEGSVHLMAQLEMVMTLLTHVRRAITLQRDIDYQVAALQFESLTLSDAEIEKRHITALHTLDVAAQNYAEEWTKSFSGRQKNKMPAPSLAELRSDASLRRTLALRTLLGEAAFESDHPLVQMLPTVYQGLSLYSQNSIALWHSRYQRLNERVTELLGDLGMSKPSARASVSPRLLLENLLQAQQRIGAFSVGSDLPRTEEALTALRLPALHPLLTQNPRTLLVPELSVPQTDAPQASDVSSGVRLQNFLQSKAPISELLNHLPGADQRSFGPLNLAVTNAESAANSFSEVIVNQWRPLAQALTTANRSGAAQADELLEPTLSASARKDFLPLIQTLCDALGVDQALALTPEALCELLDWSAWSAHFHPNTANGISWGDLMQVRPPHCYRTPLVQALQRYTYASQYLLTEEDLGLLDLLVDVEGRLDESVKNRSEAPRLFLDTLLKYSALSLPELKLRFEATFAKRALGPSQICALYWLLQKMKHSPSAFEALAADAHQTPPQRQSLPGEALSIGHEEIAFWRQHISKIVQNSEKKSSSRLMHAYRGVPMALLAPGALSVAKRAYALLTQLENEPFFRVTQTSVHACFAELMALLRGPPGDARSWQDTATIHAWINLLHGAENPNEKGDFLLRVVSQHLSPVELGQFYPLLFSPKSDDFEALSQALERGENVDVLAPRFDPQSDGPFQTVRDDLFPKDIAQRTDFRLTSELLLGHAATEFEKLKSYYPAWQKPQSENTPASVPTWQKLQASPAFQDTTQLFLVHQAFDHVLTVQAQARQLCDAWQNNPQDSGLKHKLSLALAQLMFALFTARWVHAGHHELKRSQQMLTRGILEIFGAFILAPLLEPVRVLANVRRARQIIRLKRTSELAASTTGAALRQVSWQTLTAGFSSAQEFRQSFQNIRVWAAQSSLLAAAERAELLTLIDRLESIQLAYLRAVKIGAHWIDPVLMSTALTTLHDALREARGGLPRAVPLLKTALRNLVQSLLLMGGVHSFMAIESRVLRGLSAARTQGHRLMAQGLGRLAAASPRAWQLPLLTTSVRHGARALVPTGRVSYGQSLLAGCVAGPVSAVMMQPLTYVSAQLGASHSSHVPLVPSLAVLSLHAAGGAFFNGVSNPVATALERQGLGEFLFPEFIRAYAGPPAIAEEALMKSVGNKMKAKLPAAE